MEKINLHLFKIQTNCEKIFKMYWFHLLSQLTALYLIAYLFGIDSTMLCNGILYYPCIMLVMYSVSYTITAFMRNYATYKNLS